MSNRNNKRSSRHTLAKLPRPAEANQAVQKFNIFLSHKHHDERFALRLKEILAAPCSGLLDVHLMEEISSGSDWRRWIRDHLAKSNMLLLLFTDPTAEWDWCLYEAGMFAGLHEDSVLKGEDEDYFSRVVCMHNLGRDSDLPPQLHHLQALPGGNLKRVKGFLKELYLETNTKWEFSMPLAPGVRDNNEKQLNDIAADIVKAWNEGKVLEYKSYGKQIEIDLVNPSLIVDEHGMAKIPGDAAVDGLGLKLFNLEGKHQWKDVEKATKDLGDQEWMRELAISMAQACEKKSVTPIKGIYHRPNDRNERAYRPCLYRADWTRDGAIKFQVLFSEEPSLQRDSDVVLPVLNFSELMKQLVELFDSSDGGYVKMLAFTPALGFLARKEEEWKSLEDRIRRNARRISITCLCEEDLIAWHSRFLNRHTERGIVTKELIKEASDISEELLTKIPIQTRLRWDQLPDYYAFKNDKRSILVTPFHLPRRTDGTGKDREEEMQNVEMFGSVTNHPEIVQKVDAIQDFYGRRPRASGHSA